MEAGTEAEVKEEYCSLAQGDTTVGWAFPCQTVIKKMPRNMLTGRCDEGGSSEEVPFSQSIPALRQVYYSKQHFPPH